MKFRLRVPGRPVLAWSLIALGGLVSWSCSPLVSLTNTATLGGNNPGGRGNLRVAFINETPFRAIFTYGTYDPENPGFTPQFRQFSVSPTAASRLEGNSESAPITLQCARAVSIGSAEFIERLRDAGLVDNASEEALQPGISFSDRPLDDPQAGQPVAGHLDGIETVQGLEFPCEALLVYTLRTDATQPSGFRLDLQVVLP